MKKIELTEYETATLVALVYNNTICLSLRTKFDKVKRGAKLTLTASK